MASFYLGAPRADGEVAPLAAEESRHVLKVLRMNVGDELCAIDGCGGRFEAKIDSVDQNTVWVKLCNRLPDNESAVRITLYQGLPKADKMELIIQKAVELGVYQVIPVAVKRCVVKLDEKKEASKLKRWQGIAEAAAKQSKRGIIPQVTGCMSFHDAVKMAAAMDVRLIPYELAEDMQKTRELIDGLKPGQEIAIFIGPEGGFDDGEIREALDNGIQPVTLGRRILRTETAGMTVLAWIGYVLEGREA